MKGRKPKTSRMKRAFVLAAAALGFTIGTAGINTIPKHPATDTQVVSTINQGQWDQKGVNISPTDQMWKHTLSLRSDEAKAADLMQAAQSGDSWRVKALFENGGMNARSAVAGEALASAAYFGHMDVVKALMSQGVDPTMNDSAALRWALQGGQNNVAYYLLDLGAQANANNSEGLLIATYNGDHTMVQTLLYYGADPTAWDKAALSYAQEYGYTDIATTLQDQINRMTVTPDAEPMGPFLTDDGADPVGPFSPINYRGPGYTPGTSGLI